ncbi:TrkA family potassium uptake protein [Arcanobacterium haemolyticum]|uniref:Trk system potassium uptake protein TrkA n=1 Tax=Arcanobacterium haemolyticum (strain ATCC 9345 / DSM 20595 / CCM 5947 / CCUG 17215 / LMG 16163 / NBRC 15585 / NCTC 8452 / 11018) TaxID=644284 RepID=D7BNK8_ARCHD|nr:TrkA family potassium uptake protein [Arcanobacterium haemolyticum]ADH92507.1 TrkA-N domain protein [Arcanobacterium haemolyticum DSM 20595]QCX46632.1 TrkA family potassium uptake protein [Arcanobacterium haemolyticum]SPT75023.1 Trk system potassium uptake protein trkA [Arcanobacterium haemolyticum]SQH28763.1 Trk system potassium uptake protein trkA [Arcanobacterium haemolyticum]
MKVLIGGAGSVGRSIARELAARGHDIFIVDRSPQAMRVASVPAADWILGDACELDTLDHVGMDTTDIVVAATGDDKANLVLSLLAKTEFGIPRVIARVNNPANEWLFDESWGVDVAVSTPRIMTNLIEDAVGDGTFARKLDFIETQASMFQGQVAKGAPIVGTLLGDLVLPPDFLVASVLRDGTALVADADLTIDAGDQLVVIGNLNNDVAPADLNALIAAAPAPAQVAQTPQNPSPAQPVEGSES